MAVWLFFQLTFTYLVFYEVGNVNNGGMEVMKSELGCIWKMSTGAEAEDVVLDIDSLKTFTIPKRKKSKTGTVIAAYRTFRWQTISLARHFADGSIRWQVVSLTVCKLYTVLSLRVPVNSYPNQLVPKSTRTQCHPVFKSTRTQSKKLLPVQTGLVSKSITSPEMFRYSMAANCSCALLAVHAHCWQYGCSACLKTVTLYRFIPRSWIG